MITDTCLCKVRQARTVFSVALFIWINGIRADLWVPVSGKLGKQRKQPDLDLISNALPDSVVSRVATVIQEGALRRACAALLQDPPVNPTNDVVSALRLLHPGPPIDERASLGSLRCIAARAAPTAEVDQIGKALHSFPSTSGAGLSGLRPSHIRGAMRPASADLLLRLYSEVVNLLLQSKIPELVRPYVCGASIMALRKPNGSLRPLATG